MRALSVLLRKRTPLVVVAALLTIIAITGVNTAVATGSANAAEVESPTPTLALEYAAASVPALSPEEQYELDRLATSATAIETATNGDSFDYAAAVSSGAVGTTARQWALGVALAGGHVVNAPEGLVAAAASAPVTGAFAACRGENKIWTDYLGGHARFSSCVTPKLVSALQAGVGATALAATIATAATLGVAAVSAIVPALLQYSAWSIDACSKNGTGVELVFAGLICWAQ